MPLQTGQTLQNKYRIERTIGEGGFGYVYQAVDLRTKTWVAIKELKPEAAGDKTVLNRFISEARAVQALNDPHIVRFFDYVDVGSRHFLVLEFMDGGSLADLLSSRRILSLAEAAKIASGVCDGLAVVHQRGIVHRDIKPSNVLVTGGGRIVKIGDFGIAHVPSALTGITQMTRTGMTMGTPWFMSPEQARGERVDARSDLYSVGVMLYEMCAGYTYLDFTSDMFRDVELVKSEPPRILPPNTPQRLQQIILHSLEKNPNARFQSAAEMSAALKPSTSPETVIAIPARPRLVTRTVSAPRRNFAFPLIVSSAVAVVVLFVLGLIFAVRTASLTPPAGLPAAITPTSAAALGTRVAATIVAQFTSVANVSNATETAIAVKVFATQTASAPTATRTVLPTATFTSVPTAIPVNAGATAAAQSSLREVRAATERAINAIRSTDYSGARSTLAFYVAPWFQQASEPTDPKELEAFRFARSEVDKAMTDLDQGRPNEAFKKLLNNVQPYLNQRR